MRKVLLLLIVSFSGSVWSQIILDPNTVGIDESKKMIVISCNVADLNATYPSVKEDFQIDGHIYQLDSQPAQLQKGEYVLAHRDSETYSVVFSELPLVKLNVPGAIVDTPKTPGTFTLSENGEVTINSYIGIEIRGATSQSWPKKQMEFEFWVDEAGSDDQKFAPLGFHNGDSFNLQSAYNEPLRVNSKIANDLWQQIHPEVSYQDREPDASSGNRMKFIDLFLNGEYRGLYALGEKVNRKTLKLKKEKNGQIKGELYKGESWGASTFTDLVPYDNNSTHWSGYEYKHPKEVTDWQNLYDLVDFVINSTDVDFRAHYADRFEVDNLVDYFIFLNVLRAGDNTGKNIYTVKYDVGEKYFFVPWDLDGTFGTWWNGTNMDVVNDILSNGLYNRLMNDSFFKNKLGQRWENLRAGGTLTKEHLWSMFEDNINYLTNNGAYEREHQTWNSYNYSEAQWLYQKDWIDRRLQYLETQFSSETLAVAEPDKGELFRVRLYPNPATDRIFLESAHAFEKDAEVQIVDVSGRLILSGKIGTNGFDITSLRAGVYLVLVKAGDKTTAVKFIKK